MNNYERRSPLRVTSWFREIKGRRKFARLKPVTHVAILFADANHRYLTCHAIAPGTSGDFCQSPWSAWKKCQVCYWPEAFVSKSNDIVNTWARKFFLLWRRKRIKNSCLFSDGVEGEFREPNVRLTFREAVQLFEHRSQFIRRSSDACLVRVHYSNKMAFANSYKQRFFYRYWSTETTVVISYSQHISGMWHWI